MESSNNSGKIISALLFGAAVGGVLGILFAPDKGIKTRRRISGKSEELTDSVKEKFNDFLEEMKKEVESVKESANSFMDNGTAKVDHVHGKNHSKEK